ncbi:MAG: glycosyltransferase family 39 protein [Elusimicrobiota bacterium]|nr:glycosyltransferase family 39 protein [Elusimicrobiota bacterium]
MGYKILLFILLAGLSVFRIFYATTINLSYDEAHYWEWSQHLAFDYYFNPGLIAWVIALFTWLGGNTQISVRLGAIVISIISSLLIFLLAHSITKRASIAFLSVLAIQLSPIGSLGSIIMVNDTVTMPFWTLSMICLWKIVETKKPFWWCLFSISSTLTLSGKMSSVLLFLCTFVFIVLSEKNRFWLKRKDPYLSLIISGVLFSHNIIWNAKHNFVMYRHILGLASRHQPEFFKSTLEFVGSQALLFSPILFILAISAMFWSVWHGLKSRRDDLLFLASFSSTIFLFFLLLSFRSKIEGNWSNIGFPAAFVLTFIYIREVNWKKLLKFSSVATGLLFALFLSSAMHYPVILQKLGVKLTVESDRTNEIHGWDFFSKKFSEVLKNSRINKDNIFIFGSSYQISSIVRFYTEGQPRTYCLPHANRQPNQYDIWSDWSELKSKDGIFVSDGKVSSEIMEALKYAFKKIELLTDIPIYRREYKEPIRIMRIYYCRNFLGKDRLSPRLCAQ